MAETEFLAALGAWLTTQANLSPAPATVGVAEPVTAQALPAVVLSLESVQRPGSGLGERSELVVDGALQWTATIDLANPVLPEEPGFTLLSGDRKELILQHGGLRRSDGTEGELGPDDLTVKVGATDMAVVEDAPGTGEVQADPAIGLLRFGDPLPPAGTLTATYFLGQWERRVTRTAGVLRVDVRDGTPNVIADLSTAVVRALQRKAMPGLHSAVLTSLSSIGLADEARANSRGRTALVRFEYEHVINAPDSSGGVMDRITVETRMEAGVKVGKNMVIDRNGTRNEES